VNYPAITYFRAVRTIMGPVCLTAVFGMGTGVTTRVWSPGISTGSGKSCVSGRASPWVLHRAWGHCPGVMTATGREVNAVKRSAVSTGQLSALLHLHTPPIDLVIFQEPSQQAAGGLISR